MQAPPKRVVDLLQLRPHPHTLGQPPHDEMTSSRLPADVREAEEVKCIGLAPSAPPAIRLRKPAEFDQTGLFGVQFQSESRESIAEIVPKPPGLPLVLEAHDEVVGIPNDDCLTLGLPTPLVAPEVKHVVKIDVRKQW